MGTLTIFADESVDTYYQLEAEHSLSLSLSLSLAALEALPSLKIKVLTVSLMR
jgi:hypothetical protein